MKNYSSVPQNPSWLRIKPCMWHHRYQHRKIRRLPTKACIIQNICKIYNSSYKYNPSQFPNKGHCLLKEDVKRNISMLMENWRYTVSAEGSPPQQNPAYLYAFFITQGRRAVNMINICKKNTPTTYIYTTYIWHIYLESGPM